MNHSPLFSPKRLCWAFWSGLLLIMVIKIYLATILDLYSDEIFYWQASSLPAIAYSDLPFMTALLVGLGAGFADASPVAVRSIFLLMGGLVPLLVIWVAYPVTGSRNALLAGVLALCIPLSGFLGLLAVPDVPLVFFGLLCIGLFSRAINSDNLLHWGLLGVCIAAGLCTHYRFFPYLLGALIFLLLHKPAHEIWKRPGFWLSCLIGIIGLYPIVYFNLTYDLGSLGFYLFDRHPWEFQWSGLLHLFKQAGLVTPPLYALLLFTLWHMVKLVRQGDRQAALMLSLSLSNLLLFSLLAPWTDSTSTSIHWPLSGYFPILIYAPEALTKLYNQLCERFSHRIALPAVKSILIIGFLGTLIALLGVGSQGFHAQLRPLIGSDVLSDKMAGWKRFHATTDSIVSQNLNSTNPIVITDNYYTLAQIEFGLGSNIDGFTIDRDKAIRDGRITQYLIWQKHSQGLKRVANRNALFITEDSTLTIPDKYAVLAEICSQARNVEFLRQENFIGGDKRFSYYLANGLATTQAADSQCPYPSQGWIDQPQENDVLSGLSQISGWIFNEDIGVNKVELLINNDNSVSGNYGLPRPDVVQVMGVETDPNIPNIGFSIDFDTTRYEDGPVDIALRITNNAGEVQIYGTRTVEVNN